MLPYLVDFVRVGLIYLDDCIILQVEWINCFSYALQFVNNYGR